ncbi:hypothetical protein GCM10010271_46660 [Streptomyces kurssanovii]|nr:hypothetical protein GCM10010271_46660 [Streptomyces kurssanovii]
MTRPVSRPRDGNRRHIKGISIPAGVAQQQVGVLVTLRMLLRLEGVEVPTRRGRVLAAAADHVHASRRVVRPSDLVVPPSTSPSVPPSTCMCA